MNRKLVTLSLVTAVLTPALAHAQSAPADSGFSVVPAKHKVLPQPMRDPKGIVAPFNATAEEAIVKDQIRSAGYSGVNSLMRDGDGTWHARAYKGPADVQVAVDRSGNISETAQR
jgi:hypothetical protein